MKSFAIVLPALLSLALATPIDSGAATVVDPGYPVKPTSKPRLCTKICAPSAESLNCGEGWSPWNFGGSVSDNPPFSQHSDYASLFISANGHVEMLGLLYG